MLRGSQTKYVLLEMDRTQLLRTTHVRYIVEVVPWKRSRGVFSPKLGALGVLEPGLLQDSSGSGQLAHSLFQPRHQQPQGHRVWTLFQLRPQTQRFRIVTRQTQL